MLVLLSDFKSFLAFNYAGRAAVLQQLTGLQWKFFKMISKVFSIT